MKNSLLSAFTLTGIAFLALFVGVLSKSGQEVHAAADSGSPLCSMPADASSPWLPKTPEPEETDIPAPRPASDCGFYRPAWQRFLVATQPTSDGPAFLTYPSFDEIFTPSTVIAERVTPREPLVLSLTPRNIERPNKAKKDRKSVV